MKPESPKCPKCGSGNVAYHLYGLFPEEEDVKSIELISYRVEYIVGALHGFEALPSNYLPVLNEANKFELEDLATRILQLHNLDNSTNNFIPKTMLQ